MLELVAQGWSSRRFHVVTDGRVAAEITLGWFREGGALTIDGAPYTLRREGAISGAFILGHQGLEVVWARKPSAWRERFEVEYEGRTYELVKASWLRNSFELREHGRTVGAVRPRNIFRRRSEMMMPEELPLPVIVFVAALVVLMWNRRNAAAASS